MGSTNSLSGSFFEVIWNQITIGVDNLPGILTAILILVIGWLVARLARRAVHKLALAANKFLERNFPSGILEEARVSPLIATLFGETIFWVIVLVALNFASEVAGLRAVSDWLAWLTALLPTLFAGIMIVVIGYVLSMYAREQIAPQTTQRKSRQVVLLGRLAQVFIISIALIVGLDQIGIDVALLIALSVVCVGALLTGLAVAFALGAREHVSNLIGARAARNRLSAGLRIKIDDVEGEILEITPTQIALLTHQGTTFVPGRFMDERLITVVAPDVGEDAVGD